MTIDETKLQMETQQIIDYIIHHAKQYESDKLIFKDIQSLIKYGYQEIIYNHLKLIDSRDLYTENVNLLKESIIKILDAKLKPKTILKKNSKKNSKIKQKISPEEKLKKKNIREQKKKEKEEKIASGIIKPRTKINKKLLSIPILVEIK